jgi:hypothetical protein
MLKLQCAEIETAAEYKDWVLEKMKQLNFLIRSKLFAANLTKIGHPLTVSNSV